ncbi:hypothetical protein [Natrialba swarupiae]|nr:hypothetical protein [Natrialba swarupiae]
MNEARRREWGGSFPGNEPRRAGATRNAGIDVKSAFYRHST